MSLVPGHMKPMYTTSCSKISCCVSTAASECCGGVMGLGGTGVLLAAVGVCHTAVGCDDCGCLIMVVCWLRSHVLLTLVHWFSFARCRRIWWTDLYLCWFSCGDCVVTVTL